MQILCTPYHNSALFIVTKKVPAVNTTTGTFFTFYIIYQICFKKSSDYSAYRNILKILFIYAMPYGIYMSSKHQTDNLNYLRVTLAPSASSFFWISSASSLEAPSLTTLGAPSTTSLASFNPRPVISRTTLITLTF